VHQGEKDQFMAASSTSFPPGKSGNPKGRPPKSRVLTNILEKAGGKKVLRDGKNLPARRMVADLVWNALTSGEIKFADDQVIRIADAQEYIALAKFVYGQIDGPPAAALDVTSQGEKIATISIVEVNHPADTESE
jgi:hypothetical protein